MAANVVPISENSSQIGLYATAIAQLIIANADEKTKQKTKQKQLRRRQQQQQQY